MLIYKINNNISTNIQSELNIFGSSRIGSYFVPGRDMTTQENTSSVATRYRNYRRYEVSNYLGNVMSVVSDRSRGFRSQNPQKVAFYEPSLIAANDYYPFGQAMYNRFYPSTTNKNNFFTKYRYGFNAKESDAEGEVQNLNTYDYGFRIYNPAIARFLSVDPLTGSYPELTPYQFASNSPIANIDLDGLERYFAADGSWLGSSGESTEIRIIGNNEVAKVAKINLDNQKNDHSWLIERSATAFVKNENSERQLLIDWARSNSEKPVEHSMTLFSTTLSDKSGNKFEVYVPGSTETNNIKNQVDPLKSQLIIDNVNLTKNSIFKRDLTIHNHPNGSLKFSDQWDILGGGREGDVPLAIELNVRMAMIPRGSNYIQLFDPLKYANPKPMNDSHEDDHLKYAKKATNVHYIYVPPPNY